MGLTVNVLEAKTRLSELLRRVERGESVTIARSGKAVAELRPVHDVDLILGGFAVELADDFFEPLPAEELAAWEGADADSASA